MSDISHSTHESSQVSEKQEQGERINPNSGATNDRTISDQKFFYILLGCVVLFAIYNAMGFWYYSIDDSYISLHYAGRLIDGLGLTYIDGERVEGFSNPSWVFILALTLLLGFNSLVGAKILGVLAHGGMIISCAAIVKRLLQPTDRQDYLLLLCGMIFLSISLPLTFWPATGMETTFYIFMIMATYWRVLYESDEISSNPQSEIFPHSAILAAITTLFRPEAPAIMLSAFCTMVLLHRKNKQNLLRWLGIFFTPTVGYLIFRLSYYGYLLPNTAYRKGVIGTFKSLYHYMLPWFQLEGIVGVIGCIGFLWLIKRTLRRGWPLFGAFAFHVIFLCSITWDWMPNQRFFVPILPFLGIGLSSLCILLRRTLFKKSGSILVALSCIVMVYQGFQSMQYRRTNHKTGYWAEAVIENTKRERNEYFPLSMSIPWKMHEKYVAFVIEHLPPKATLVCTEIGILGWATQFRIIDLDGLTSAEMSGATGLSWEQRAAYLETENPDWIITKTGNKTRFQQLMEQPWIDDYELVDYGKKNVFAAKRKDSKDPTDDEIWQGFAYAVERDSHSLKFWKKFAAWSAYLKKDSDLERACKKLAQWNQKAYCGKLKSNPKRPITSTQKVSAEMSGKMFSSRAELAFSEKRWKDAIQEYSKAIEQTPNNIDLYQKRSRAYFSEKQYLNCVNDLHKIQEIDPTRQPQKIEILAYQKEIQRLIKIQKYSKAQEVSNSSVERHPQNDQLLQLKGDIEFFKMKYRESIATYQQALQIKEKDALKLRISRSYCFLALPYITSVKKEDAWNFVLDAYKVDKKYTKEYFDKKANYKKNLCSWQSIFDKNEDEVKSALAKEFCTN